MTTSRSKKSVLILGASGFVGKSIAEVLSKSFDVITTSRTKAKQDSIYFDLQDQASWLLIKEMKPDYIINSIGYGVVKWQSDLDLVFKTNYLLICDFYSFLLTEKIPAFLIHIGTAFEYDLNEKALTESSTTIPKTFYGISKLLASNFLLQKYRQPFVILRPFNMFGPLEDSSKIVPFLILSQKNNLPVELSDGVQKRDYFYVQDLANFIEILLQKSGDINIPHVINVGSGQSIALKDLANSIFDYLPNKSTSNWKWDSIPKRQNESDDFFNASNLCFQLGFKVTDIKKALQETIKYYMAL